MVYAASSAFWTVVVVILSFTFSLCSELTFTSFPPPHHTPSFFPAFGTSFSTTSSFFLFPRRRARKYAHSHARFWGCSFVSARDGKIYIFAQVTEFVPSMVAFPVLRALSRGYFFVKRYFDCCAGLYQVSESRMWQNQRYAGNASTIFASGVVDVHL